MHLRIIKFNGVKLYAMRKFYSKEIICDVNDALDNGKTIKLTTNQTICLEDGTDIDKTYIYYIPKNRLLEITDNNQMYEFTKGKRKLCPCHIKNFDEDFLSNQIVKIIDTDNDYFNSEILLEFIIKRFNIFTKRCKKANLKLFNADWQKWSLYCSKQFYKMYNIGSIDDDNLENSLIEVGQLGLIQYNQRVGGEFMGCYYDNYYDKKRPLTSRKETISHDNYVYILCLLYAHILCGDFQKGIELARSILDSYTD